MEKQKEFISIIWGYHEQIFSFEKEQNYHMLPLEVMKEEWFQCEIFAIDSAVKIEDDPNFVEGVKVIYCKNIFRYLLYLWRNRNAIIYSNSLTIKTLFVWLIWKRTIFYPHDNIFWRTDKNAIKKIVIKFFYRFFTKIRINNDNECNEIEKIKKWLWCICPLNISNKFLDTDFSNRSWATFIWNLTHVKNPEFLIDTCKILREKKINFNIKIIWNDSYNKNWKCFKDLVVENNLEEYIDVLWFIWHKELKNILSQSLIYINTSIWEWQCLAVYEWALAWNVLCLQKIRSFPSVFRSNAFYHATPLELANNIIFLLWNSTKLRPMIINNQEMILENYNYEKIKKDIREMFLKLDI